MWRVIPMLACLAATPAAAEDARCVVEKAVASTPARVKAPRCHRASAAIAKAIEGDVGKKYFPQRGGKPEVKFSCDGLGSKVYEISIERGNGHAGTLQLWRARRRDDGKYDVRGILYTGRLSTHKVAVPPVPQQASGVVSLPRLDEARAAMTATIREVAPAKERGFRAKGSFSSRNFHIAIRFVDDAGRVLEKRFTGYASSSTQDAYLGLELAESALAPLLSLAPNQAAVDQDDKRYFAAAFNAAVPYFEDELYYWVMERYVDLARGLGTPAMLGGLLTRLAPAKKDRSRIAARANAVDAIARITGWDAREGGKKTIDEAAAAYLAACK